jgi:protein-tyrosine phosphatase
MALGVSRETVFEDYLLTNRYWDRGGREKPGMDAETVASIFSARREYLEGTFAAIESRFGSVQSYLKDHIGLDDRALGALRSACLN